MTRNDNLIASMGVDLIYVAHCSYVYPSENNTKLRIRLPSFDNNTTAVVLVRYFEATSFSGMGDDKGVYLLAGGANATIPSALNRSTPLYSFSPLTSRFTPTASGVSPNGTSVLSSYAVTGKLSLSPEITPTQTGTFAVQESHTLVAQFVAELVFQPWFICD